MTGQSAVRITLLACLALFPLTGAMAHADQWQLDAPTLFARGTSRQLALSADESAIELQRGVVIEDDGPAAGYSYRPNVEKLGLGVFLRKELIVPAPRASAATLLVGQGGELTAQVNGREVPLRLIGRQGNYWQAWQLPPDALQAGRNTFVLSGTGSVWIARDDEYAAGSLARRSHPNRSAKSSDGGKTWSDNRLGTGNDVDGEYYVRLHLDQYQASGQLTLGVIDVGNLERRAIGPPLVATGPIRLTVEADGDASTSLRIRARTGTTYVPDPATWSEWSELPGDDYLLSEPRGRFLQVELTLLTDDPLRTPSLRSVSISASPKRPEDWSRNVRVVACDNQRIVRSSIPFQYEPFDHPELAELRRRYKLDQVVAGADSEFALIQRLAGWSAGLWQRMHLNESYPPYRALEILSTHPDGTPVGGFCQQYNLVFLQACESFGLVGRLVSIGPGNWTDRIRGGHEAIEIWSNEFRKWIYVDGNAAWYAVDRESQVPLSLRELRQRQLAAFREEPFRPVQVVVIKETKYTWPDLKHWPPLVELRLIPRSNFLQQAAPVPLNQGMRGWFWTGHYVWSDKQIPDRLLYPLRTVRAGDFEWTLNQAELILEATSEPGRLRVHIDTNTPGFQTFQVASDGRLSEQSGSVFEWTLAAGQHSLNVAPRNAAGRAGVSSSLTLDYRPPAGSADD